MVKPTSIIFVLTMIILLSAGPCAAGRPVECCRGLVPIVTLTGDPPGQVHLVVAANDKISKDSQPDSETEEGAAEVPDQKNAPPKTTAKPLKPFVPSEKIKVGQVVDFPYDI